MSVKRKWHITFVRTDSAKSVNLSISRSLGTTALLSAIFLFSLFITGGVYIWQKNVQAVRFDQLKKENRMLRQQLNSFSGQMDSLMIKIRLMEEWEDKLRTDKKMKSISPDIRSLGSGGLPIHDKTFADLDKNLDIHYNQDLKKLSYLSSKINLTYNTHKDLFETMEMQQELFVSTPSILPTYGIVNDRFGYRAHPIFRYRKFHSGVDFNNEKGTPVYATADGKVIYSGRDSNYGIIIKVDHQAGYETRYAHLEKSLVSENDTVKKGQIIGLMGNTGLSTGTHLHYEVLKNNKNVNPAHFFNLSEEDIKIEG